jgi:hypothetical protein
MERNIIVPDLVMSAFDLRFKRRFSEHATRAAGIRTSSFAALLLPLALMPISDAETRFLAYHMDVLEKGSFISLSNECTVIKWIS